MFLTSALPLVLSGAQMLGGLFGKDQDRPKPQISTATNQAVQRATSGVNATQGRGHTLAQRGIRQSASDAVEQAKQSSGDPAKIAATAGAAGVGAMRALEEVNLQAERERMQQERNLQTSLARKGREEQMVRQQKDQQYMEEQAAKSNLVGAGIEGALNYSADKRLMDLFKSAGMFAGVS